MVVAQMTGIRPHCKARAARIAFRFARHCFFPRTRCAPLRTHARTAAPPYFYSIIARARTAPALFCTLFATLARTHTACRAFLSALHRTLPRLPHAYNAQSVICARHRCCAAPTLYHTAPHHLPLLRQTHLHAAQHRAQNNVDIDTDISMIFWRDGR